MHQLNQATQQRSQLHILAVLYLDYGMASQLLSLILSQVSITSKPGSISVLIFYPLISYPVFTNYFNQRFAVLLIVGLWLSFFHPLSI